MIGQAAALGEALAAFNSEPRVQQYYGKAEKTWKTYQKNLGSLAIGAHTACNHQLAVQHILSYKYSSGVELNVRSANNYNDIADHFGLEFSDIVSAAWELTPYSWAVDYFVNLGQYLSDNLSSPGGKTIYCTLATKYEARKIYTFGPVIVGNDPTISDVVFHQREFVVTEGTFTRTISDNIPTVNLHFKSIDAIAAHSFNKTLNLLSVLVQRKVPTSRKRR